MSKNFRDTIFNFSWGAATVLGMYGNPWMWVFLVVMVGLALTPNRKDSVTADTKEK